MNFLPAKYQYLETDLNRLTSCASYTGRLDGGRSELFAVPSVPSNLTDRTSSSLLSDRCRFTPNNATACDTSRRGNDQLCGLKQLTHVFMLYKQAVLPELYLSMLCFKKHVKGVNELYMAKKNRLVESPPYPVEQSVRQLGENLRLARIRRNMTIADAAERIGTGPRAVMDAEKGKPSTSMAVYAALLWLYDQLDGLSEIADPGLDREGFILESSRRRRRVRHPRELDNDF